jgi:hypothetical protein
MAALPALGFAILAAAGTAAAGPAQAQPCGPTETSSVTASSSISATSSVTPTPDQTATAEASPTVSAEPTCSSSTQSAAPTASPTPSAEPSASSSPTPSGTSSADASQVETTGEPRPAAIRGVLTADESEMEGLAFDGIVTADTATGEVQALRFTADRNRLADMRITVTQSEITQISHGSGDTFWSGHVVMDVTLFKATLLGAPVEFTPENPPPAGLIVSDMTFTGVEAHVLEVTCDTMTVDGFSQGLG